MEAWEQMEEKEETLEDGLEVEDTHSMGMEDHDGDPGMKHWPTPGVTKEEEEDGQEAMQDGTKETST